MLFCIIGKGQSWELDQTSCLTQTRPLFETWKGAPGRISKLSRILVWQSLSHPHPSHWRVHPTVSRLKLIVRWNIKKTREKEAFVAALLWNSSPPLPARCGSPSNNDPFKEMKAALAFHLLAQGHLKAGGTCQLQIYKVLQKTTDNISRHCARRAWM